MDENTRRLLLGSSGGGPKTYVEDVFSTWLYTGTGSTQTITNGIDLSGKGGLVWTKARDTTIWNHIADTARGAGYSLYTNTTDTSVGPNSNISAFNSNGFTAGSNTTNQNGNTFASWTFRKAPKFFDVVTYTGNGTARTIAHSLGSVPGCIIVKSTSQSDNWKVYHRSLTSNAYYILLDSTAAQSNAVDLWNSTTPTSTEFSIGSSGNINTNGATYVAYLFAHDAGGFGDSGNDNIVSCGTFTGSGYNSTTTVTLGWEPQWILAKRTDGTQNWVMMDTMRGMPNGGEIALLYPNLSNAEANNINSTGYLRPTATGFLYGPDNYMGDTAQIVYIAIRRGPMKTPTDATKVFTTNAYTGNGGTNRVISGVGFPPDLMFGHKRSATGSPTWYDRLRGKAQYLQSSSTGAEGNTGPVDEGLLGQDSFTVDDSYSLFNANTATYAMWLMRRAPGFFDVVAYTGTGSARTVAHNLGVVPELMITKVRSGTTAAWGVYVSALGATKNLELNAASAEQPYGSNLWNSTVPTSTVFSVNDSSWSNGSSYSYIAYLFASCPGVSKVGSYTGTGTTLQINCGFTAGARFVMIKRTDSTGDWYVWDSARGIISGNDPYLLLNSAAAEVTNTDYIDPYSPGFEISSTAPAAINASGGTFIYLAVA